MSPTIRYGRWARPWPTRDGQGEHQVEQGGAARREPDERGSPRPGTGTSASSAPGPNTLSPYRENPPDLTIAADDIVFADFGPLFEEFEADLGAPTCSATTPQAPAAADLPVIFDAGQRYFASHPGITGADCYAEVARLASEAGWCLGGTHAGHLVGEFPHEKIDGADIESYIAPGNATPMRRLVRDGRACHWILEIHLIDPGASSAASTRSG